MDILKAFISRKNNKINKNILKDLLVWLRSFQTGCRMHGRTELVGDNNISHDSIFTQKK